jgi:hypothetical protein
VWAGQPTKSAEAAHEVSDWRQRAKSAEAASVASG